METVILFRFQAYSVFIIHLYFFIWVENAEVNIDCESFIRQSPSNRPPALLPPDAHLPNVTNEDQQESSTGGLPG